MANTDTSYLGLRLPHPFIAGASPFGYQLDAVRRLEDAGAAAIVLHSLFEEQITMMSDGRIAGMDVSNPDFSEVIAEFPEPEDYSLTPEGYAEHIHRLKKTVASRSSPR
jgi:dihydroorotate dehydrogenase (fumarate)